MPSEVGLIGDWLRSMWPRIDEAAGRKVEAVLTVRPLAEKWHAALQGAGFQIRVEADTADEAGDQMIARIVQQVNGETR